MEEIWNLKQPRLNGHVPVLFTIINSSEVTAIHSLPKGSIIFNAHYSFKFLFVKQQSVN